jgi:hypothetical protein
VRGESIIPLVVVVAIFLIISVVGISVTVTVAVVGGVGVFLVGVFLVRCGAAEGLEAIVGGEGGGVVGDESAALAVVGLVVDGG